MANLSGFPFTKGNDVATSPNGWVVSIQEIIDALTGHDAISGRAAAATAYGIFTDGVINTGEGHDVLSGSGSGVNLGFGIRNLDHGVINTDDGNDTVSGTGSGNLGFGLRNLPFGVISTAEGNDSVSGLGVGLDKGFGIDNNGVIDTGASNDSVLGIAKGPTAYGIFNDGPINTGDGNDNVTGKGEGGLAGYGIYIRFTGSIDTGDGNDIVLGKREGASGCGIFNDGIINTGDGKDTVEAFAGGFSGFGTTNLGDDDDTLKGFGTGSFNGGFGTDKLLFGDGVYVINAGVVSFDGVAMTVSSFERVGGVNGGLFAFRNGTLTVASGVANFQHSSLNTQG